MLANSDSASSSLINDREAVGVGSLESLETIVHNEIAATKGLSSEVQTAILTATADYLSLKRHDLYTVRYWCQGLPIAVVTSTGSCSARKRQSKYTNAA